MNLGKFVALSTLLVSGTITSAILADSAADFARIRANPMAYHGKRVTVMGLADVGGAEFFLYRDSKEGRNGIRPLAITWDLSKGAIYEEFNNHWVQVTGIVNANRHGPLGGNPCEIRAEKVQPLPRPPVPDQNIYGVFRNDTSYTVDIKYPTSSGYGWTLNVSPGHVGGSAIAGGRVTVLGPKDKIIAQKDITLTGAAKHYLDAEKRTYYYRITNGRIELVAPSEGKRW